MLWKMRNECVFEGAQPAISMLASRTKEEARLWTKAGAKGVRIVLPETWDVH
jgi:hypothetical protein